MAISAEKNNYKLSLIKVVFLIFIPSAILMLVYVLLGHMQEIIPSLLLFYVCAVSILFPIEIGVILNASKKEYGTYSLKSAFANHKRMSWWKIFLYGSFLFAFAGIMSVVVAPLENNLLAPLSDKLTESMPVYFDWNNVEFLKQYPKDILLLTSVSYFIFNVFVGPIVEELFFRGYLTSKISRYGNLAPVIITILFSLYHFWLPFNNIFRISIFLPAALIAWRMKNIYISIVFHCMCNLFATVSFIIGVYS